LFWAVPEQTEVKMLHLDTILQILFGYNTQHFICSHCFIFPPATPKLGIALGDYYFICIDIFL
jgi:hypothetical protein